MDGLDGLSADELRALLRRPPDAPKGRKRKPERKTSYLTEEELRALFRAVAAAGSVRDLAIFELAFGRGLRASEVGRIQLADLRLNAKRVWIHRLKGGNSGDFVLTEREIRALRPWVKERGQFAGPLFPSRNSKPISRRRLDNLMKQYGAAAGIPEGKRHFHCLRHSCATTLLEKGVDVADVQDILGHADVRNTMIYAKVTNKKRKQTGEKLQNEW